MMPPVSCLLCRAVRIQLQYFLELQGAIKAVGTTAAYTLRRKRQLHASRIMHHGSNPKESSLTREAQNSETYAPPENAIQPIAHWQYESQLQSKPCDVRRCHFVKQERMARHPRLSFSLVCLV